MTLTLVQYALGALSGGVVGFTLGMFGGGGSILAVPLMVYFVGVPNPHLAIGTSAFAVAVNAATGLVEHARHGVVRWRCAAVFSVVGMGGALCGSLVGKAIDGRKLLILFAVLMIAVGVMMVRTRDAEGDPAASLSRVNAPRLAGAGALTGALAGFFGIGGGFLIVPGLIAATGMPIINAIGSSLVAVTAFGLTTAVSYALSGLVDWPLAAVFIGGGIAGSQAGCLAARHTAAARGVLKSLFALLIFAVAAAMIVEGWRTS